MSESPTVIGVEINDPMEAAHVADALAQEGIQAEVSDLGQKVDRSPAHSTPHSRLLVRPEDRERAETLFVEVRVYQYLKGWGGSQPGYKTPLVKFAREIKRLRMVHKIHIGSALALVVFLLFIGVFDAFYSVQVPTVLEWLAGSAALVFFLSGFLAGFSICPRCKKLFHHRFFLFTIFETQCLSCGFHLWNNDGI
jgi:hypothetical protein